MMKKYAIYALAALLAAVMFAAGACTGAVTEKQARQTAEDYVKSSPTFVFDGMEDTLKLVNTLQPDGENTWQFVFQFDSRQAGYGDRTGQMLAQVITPHEAVITVTGGTVTSAVMDGAWDMMKQELLDDMEIDLAPIHDVTVAFLESFPVQVMASINGGLRDGCTTLHNIDVSRDGNTVNITVTTQRPKDAVCTAVYTYFDENVNIGTEFTTGTTYTVNVNDFSTTFTYP